MIQKEYFFQIESFEVLRKNQPVSMQLFLNAYIFINKLAQS